ncbi:MAG: ATP-binding protein [Myxococcota bacterium]
MRPRALISWSTGKDAAWALHVVRRAGALDVVGALTTVAPAYGRVAMHGVRTALLDRQLEGLGLPGVRVDLPVPCPNAAYEAAMGEALRAAKAEGVTHVVFGDLFLEDIRAYREAQLAPLGIEPVFPLFGEDTAALARAMIDGGLEARIATLDPRKLPRALAGRAFDGALLAELPADVDPCGENGEMHTLVTAGPMFAPGFRLDVEVGEVVDREGFVYADLVRPAQ